MVITRPKAALVGAIALATLSVSAIARQFHGVGGLDCDPILVPGASAALNLTATGPNTGTVTISSEPAGVISWSGTPSWNSNNQATVMVTVDPNYSGLVLITAGANGQSASTSATTSSVILP